MFIEQIIKFALKGSGPPSCTCNLQLVIFMTKQEFLRKIFERIIFYWKNIAGGSAPYFVQTGPSHLQNLTPKRKILNVLWT